MFDQLTGEYTHNLDDKGRLAIPAKLREKLGDVVMVTVGWENCLEVYPEKTWIAKSAKAIDLPTLDAEIRDLLRWMFASASDCEMDKQGRILIPQSLRSRTGITDSVTIIGLGNYMELWDTPTWEAERIRLFQNRQQLARNLTDRGRAI